MVLTFFKKYTSKILVSLLLPLFAIIFYLSGKKPFLVEYLYSLKIFKIISYIQSYLNQIVAFSIGEILLFSFIFSLITYIINTIYKLIKHKNKKQILFKFLLNIVCLTAILYSSFLILWGFNYNRTSIEVILNYDTKPSSVKELERLCTSLTLKLNELRPFVKENSNGIMILNDSKKLALSRAYLGYNYIYTIIPNMPQPQINAKYIINSELMTYLGISGIYFPFTGEANVNINISSYNIPFTACHEIAHSKGFAKEDDANYISYLACINHPDIDFRYSGYAIAYIYSINKLYSENKDKYQKTKLLLNDGTRKDFIYNSKLWAQYKGKVSKISSKINNTYLKANNQADGIKSYGKFVDLLLAEQRNKISSDLLINSTIES